MQVQAISQHPQDATVTLQDVHFSYDGKTEVIKGVSLDIQQGQTVAFVGPSGGGKTTVSRLAARFWDYQKGRITVGGMDVSQIDPEKLMSLYSIVFQDVTLFDNTILENIRLGRKWNTNIGENGCALSRLIKHKTVLIIAHRMRTVAGADKIVVLSDGVVAEQGAPDALYARNGQYTHMVDLQTESQSCFSTRIRQLTVMFKLLPYHC